MKKKKIFFTYLIIIAALLAAALLSLSFGSAKLRYEEMIKGLLCGKGYEYEAVIMLKIRLPRLLASIISGIGLSLSGVLLQSVMANDLASPNTIGVSSGAGLMTVICLSLFPALSIFLPIAAFIGAFGASVLIMLISRAAGGGRSTVILAGIALTSLFSAGISFVLALDTDAIASYNSFSVGGFDSVTIKNLILPFIIIFSCLVLSIFVSGRITALGLGDDIAAGLGIHPIRLRAFCLMLAALSAASVVSFAGLLGFVGLIVPHITRKLVGHELLPQLFCAPPLGALIVTVSDLAGRTLFAPAEISVGIIMAFVGAPFFFVLLLKRRGDHYA